MKEWVNLHGTAFKRFVKERGVSYRGSPYTVMSGLYCREHEVPAVCVKTEGKYSSTVNDRGRLGTYWDEVTWQCPECKKECKMSENHTEKDENYYSNEERRVYRIHD